LRRSIVGSFNEKSSGSCRCEFSVGGIVEHEPAELITHVLDCTKIKSLFVTLPIFITKVLYLFAGKPDPPRNLTISGVTESTAGLSWQPPELDGGSPITGYIVEMRTASKKTWNKVDTTPSLEFNVTGLTEGTEYVFHVAAQNAVGISDFVELEKGVTPKGKFGKADVRISFNGFLPQPVRTGLEPT
jgi:hypothetical protein